MQRIEGARASTPLSATVLSRRSLLGAVAAAGATAGLAGCGSGGGSGGSSELNVLFMKQAGYSADDIKAMTKAFQKANPKITVHPTFVAYEALHDKIVAAAPAGTYDVVLIDVIWPTEFATKKMIRDVTKRFPSSWDSEIFQGALKTGEYKNHYYGVPWILDTKYLYFNDTMLKDAGLAKTDLRTWDGVVKAAKRLKKSGVAEHPLIWSWSQAEAVICDYATLLGAFGGRFLDGQGMPAFNTGGGLKALEFMQMTLDSGLSNPNSTQSLEDDVLKVFSSGKAAIAENWTYMYNNANDPKQSQVSGDVAIAHTPAGPSGKAPGVNGSMALAISTGTDKVDLAWKYVKSLTSKKTQDRFAEHSLPVWKSSYEDPEVTKTAPAVVKVAKTQLPDMILRPQVPSYNAISQHLQVEIQNALLGKKSAKKALDDAAASARELLKKS